MTTPSPTSPLDQPKADLNHDLDNTLQQTANQADMPGKPMRLPDDPIQLPGTGDDAPLQVDAADDDDDADDVDFDDDDDDDDDEDDDDDDDDETDAYFDIEADAKARGF